MRTILSAIAITAVIMTIAPPVWAGRPLTTEDPGTISQGNFEIEIGNDFSETADGVTSFGHNYNVGFGILDNLEFDVNVPVIFYQEVPGQDAVTGLGDTGLLLKWRFLEEKGFRPALGTYGTVSLPSGNDNEGLGTGTVDFGLFTFVGKNIWKFLVEANLGWSFLDNTDDLFFYSAGLEYYPHDKWSIVFEYVGQTDFKASTVNDISDITIGLTYSLLDFLTLDAGAIFGFTTSTPDYGATVGVTFHPEFKKSE